MPPVSTPTPQNALTPQNAVNPSGENSRPFSESGNILNQSSEEPDTAADPNMPLDELKDKVISEIEFTKTFLAVSLKNSGDWLLSGNKIIIPVSTAYIKKQIDSEKRALTQLVAKFKSPDYEVTSELDQSKEETKEKLPPEIDNLCKLFNGEVVNIGAVTDNTPAVPKQNVTETDSEDSDYELQVSQDFYEDEGDQDEF